MIAKGGQVDSCVSYDRKYIFLICKFDLSAVNCHKSHIDSLLIFNVNCIESTVLTAGVTFDAK